MICTYEIAQKFKKPKIWTFRIFKGF